MDVVIVFDRLCSEIGEKVVQAVEYGLLVRADSWALRIFEAAIIDIAFVILAVFSTLLILRLSCLTLGIVRGLA